MYYILNQTNQVIAADDSLLELLHVQNIDELTKQIVLGDIQFTSLEEESMTVVSPHNTSTYTIQTSILSSLLGNLRLVHILSNPDEAKDNTNIDFADNQEIAPQPEESLNDSTASSIASPDEIDELLSVQENLDISPDNNIIEEMPIGNKNVSLLNDTEITKESFNHTNEESNDSNIDTHELFNLTIPNAPEKTIDEISLEPNDTFDNIEKPMPHEFDVLSSIEEDNFVKKDKNSLEVSETLETISEPEDLQSDITLLDDTLTKENDPSLDANNPLESISEPECIESDITLIDDATKKDNISLDLNENHDISFTETEALATEEEIFTPLDTSPIIIDIDKISKNIGISSEDYTLFLNEYIDTAISLESDLKDRDINKRNTAIDTLTQLADVLELPSVNEIIIKLRECPIEESDTLIDSFYATISRLTTQTNKVASISTFTDVSVPEETSLELSEPQSLEISEVSSKIQDKGFGTISLEGTKPIHFNFRLEEAANDLSLPVELIEEFVHDFIEQAHTETKKMLDAYEKGDLDTIQKIGHMLKGASSNLRINALSDTLYEIQFCEDSNALEDLIKQYWGHFLSFEQQIDMLSK